METICIIGAGLAGCALAHYLAPQGHRIKMFEMRPDMRSLDLDYGRSINLALSKRGMTCLEELGLLDAVMDNAVAMRARAIYDRSGDIRFQDFGRHHQETIYSIQRHDLNQILLSSIEAMPNVELFFEHEFISVDLKANRLQFEKGAEQPLIVSFDRLFGADGAASKLRNFLSDSGDIRASREWLPHVYKELSLAKKYCETLPREHLHLWPRETFLLLGNPNSDDSVTGTLFIPKDGEHGLSQFSDRAQLSAFMHHYFPNVAPHMENLADEFFHHPTGHLSTVKAAPWYVGDNCCLIGDAAHAVVPFFGQGMNCAFEDCRILNQMMHKHPGQWDVIMRGFYQERKRNTDAIAAMSMDNYHEIHSGVNDPSFNLKKSLDSQLMEKYPDIYLSKHVMVMFTNIPYASAQACGALQSELLAELCGGIDSLEQLDWQHVSKRLETYHQEQSKILANSIS